jgi:hypothetical protein
MKYILLVFLLCGCETLQVDGGSITIDFAATETAHVYRNKTTGELLYCSNQHVGQPRDFDYVGTAQVQPSEIKLCELA